MVMLHHHENPRDLLRSVSNALDWRKCVLGGASVGVFVIGLELLLLICTLGRHGLITALQVALAIDGDKPAQLGLGVAMLAVAALWASYVYAYFGGAIARLAAIEAATGRRAPLREGLAFAKVHFRGLFWAPAGALLVALLLLLPAPLAGLVGRLWGVGPSLVAACFPLLLASAAAGLLLAMGTAAAWGLMTSAVAVEETFAFDAASRALGYLCGRPWHALGYRLISWLIGALVTALAVAFAYLIWRTTDTLVASTMGPQHGKMTAMLPALLAGELTRGGSFGGLVYSLVAAGYAALTLGVPISYITTSGVVQYLLLRRHLDGTSMREIQLDPRFEQRHQGGFAYDPLVLKEEIWADEGRAPSSAAPESAPQEVADAAVSVATTDP